MHSHSENSRRSAAALTLLTLLTLFTGCSERAIGAADLAAIVDEVAFEEKEERILPEDRSPARIAVRESIRHLLKTEKMFSIQAGKRCWRHELSSYLFRDESYIGGKFPQGTADIFREIEQLETDFLAELKAFPELLAREAAKAEVPEEERKLLTDEFSAAVATKWKPVVDAIEAHRKFVAVAAELYELVAANSDSFVAKRDGLKISDSYVEGRFEKRGAEIDEAHDAIEPLYKALDATQGKLYYWIGSTRRANKKSDVDG